jgi:hypothetical protein
MDLDEWLIAALHEKQSLESEEEGKFRRDLKLLGTKDQEIRQ